MKYKNNYEKYYFDNIACKLFLKCLLENNLVTLSIDVVQNMSC